MSVIVTLAVATTLIDKYFVSARLPIEQLGVYSIASSLGMGVLQAVYPIFSAALPRLVEIGGDHAARWEANLRLLRIILPMILLGAGLYAVLGRTVLQVWLHDADLARRVAAILDFVLLSSAFNAIYNIGYSNWVSAARTPWIVFVNVTALVIALVATPLAIDAFGLRGAAAALVIINSVGVLATILWLALSRLYLRQAPAA